MKKILSKSIIFSLLISILISFSHLSYADDLEEEEILNVSSEISASLDEIKVPKLPSINSRSYVVIDRNTNTILLGKQEHEKRKMASTTKIMTAIVILEKYNLSDRIEISKKAAGTGGSRLGLKAGDNTTVQDLLYGLMLRSGNDAAVALAEYAGGDLAGFATLMNEKAESLNLTNTHFETPHGLDSDLHYTTAYELALLSNYAMKNKIFAGIVNSKNHTIMINNTPRSLVNTNELLGNLSGIYGIKTGFTNGANRCLVTACKRGDMDIICVVLGADTKKFRTTDSIKLIEYSFQNFEMVNLQEQINEKFRTWNEHERYEITLNKAKTKELECIVEELSSTFWPIRKDLIPKLAIDIHYDNNLESPLPKGEIIGNIQVTCDGTEILHTTILTAKTIKKKRTLFYLFEFLKNFPQYTEVLT